MIMKHTGPYVMCNGHRHGRRDVLMNTVMTCRNGQLLSCKPVDDSPARERSLQDKQ